MTANNICLANNELLSLSNKESGNLKDVDSVIEKALQAYGDKEHLLLFANRAQYIGNIAKESNDWEKQPYKYVRKDNFWRKDIEVKSAAQKNKIESILFEGKNYWQFSKAQTNTENALNDGDMPPAAPSIKNTPSNISPELSVITSEQGEWLADEAEREPFLLANWGNPTYQFKFIGHSNYKQIPAYAIEIKDAKGKLTTAYIDGSNFLVLAMTFQSYPTADTNAQFKRVTVTKEFSENRPALGSIWPFKESILVNKESISTVELSTIKLADDIVADYFVPPVAEAGATALNSTFRPARLSSPIIIPFEYCQREIICRGKIENTEPLWFLIDTGGSETIIDRSFAAQCLLPRGNNFRIFSFRGNVQAQSTKIDRLELGGLIINDLNAQIADLSSHSKQVGRSIAGIIGMNVLSNYLITIDYAKPCLIFADAYSGLRPEGVSVVPFAQLTNSTGAVVNEPILPRIKIGLPGSDTQAFLMDTGAAFNHLSADIANRHLPENIEKTSHSIEATGLDGKPIQLGIITLDPIIIGSYKVHKVKFTYPVDHSMPKTSTGTLQPKLGADVLSKDLDIAGVLGNPFLNISLSL